MTSKEIERAILDLCVSAIPGFPDGSVADHEGPDFLVMTGNRTIGVELQEYIQGAGQRGAPARRDESMRAMIMQSAQREFESRHPSTHLYVYAHFRRPAALDRRTARFLAREVASLVENLVPPPPAAGQVISRRDASYLELESARLTECLARLDVHLYPRATYGLWASPEWGYSSRDLVDLHTQVQAKESKVPSYRQSCDELWLVLYSLALPSGGFDMEGLEAQRWHTTFDRVVFLDAVSRNYLSLAG